MKMLEKIPPKFASVTLIGGIFIAGVIFGYIAGLIVQGIVLYGLYWYVSKRSKNTEIETDDNFGLLLFGSIAFLLGTIFIDILQLIF